MPDIVLYKSADEYVQTHYQARVVVRANGSVFWAPPTKILSSCHMDVTFFPFDDQVYTFIICLTFYTDYAHIFIFYFGYL